MKRYLLFAGYQYYPNGGWKDFIKDYNTSLEAKLKGDSLTTSTTWWWEKLDWYEIVDTKTKKIIIEI